MFEIIDSSGIKNLFEKPSNNNGAPTPPIAYKEEENGEQDENGFEAAVKHTNKPTTAEIINIIEKNNMTLTDKPMFERKFDQLNAAQKVACKRVLITSIDHPTLRKKKTHSNKYRTLNFGGKFRLVARDREIL